MQPGPSIGSGLAEDHRSPVESLPFHACVSNLVQFNAVIADGCFGVFKLQSFVARRESFIPEQAAQKAIHLNRANSALTAFEPGEAPRLTRVAFCVGIMLEPVS